MLLGFDCKINCWECTRKCEITESFQFPEPIFSYVIMKSLKATAGLAICEGMKKEIVNEKLKVTAVSLYVARKKYLEVTPN